jgi:hypothetical protein
MGWCEEQGVVVERGVASEVAKKKKKHLIYQSGQLQHRGRQTFLALLMVFFFFYILPFKKKKKRIQSFQLVILL